jgi:hypothetical protein
MYPVVIQAMASQRIAEMRAAAASRRRPPAPDRETASSVRQRVGWALIDVGLRLAVRHARA